MGDRTFARIEIGGHLETVAEAEALLEAIVKDDIAEDREHGLLLMRQAVETARDITFEDEQRNYGVFSNVDNAVVLLPRMECRTSFESGGDYNAGKSIVYDGKSINMEGDNNISRTLVRTALLGGMDDVVELLDLYDRLEDGDMPPLTASPAVATWLKIFGKSAA